MPTHPYIVLSLSECPSICLILLNNFKDSSVKEPSVKGDFLQVYGPCDQPAWPVKAIGRHCYRELDFQDYSMFFSEGHSCWFSIVF